MAYAPIQPYVKGQPGFLPDSEKKYVEKELQKIMRTLQDMLIVIQEIQSKVVYP